MRGPPCIIHLSVLFCLCVATAATSQANVLPCGGTRRRSATSRVKPLAALGGPGAENAATNSAVDLVETKIIEGVLHPQVFLVASRSPSSRLAAGGAAATKATNSPPRASRSSPRPPTRPKMWQPKNKSPFESGGQLLEEDGRPARPPIPARVRRPSRGEVSSAGEELP